MSLKSDSGSVCPDKNVYLDSYLEKVLEKVFNTLKTWPKWSVPEAVPDQEWCLHSGGLYLVL